MAPSLSTLSSNSAGSSTRATRLYRPGKTRPRRSSSWSSRVSVPLLKPFHSISSSRGNGDKDRLAADPTYLAPPEQGDPSTNQEGKSRPGRQRRQQKSVTFEEPVQESNSDDIESPEGTVRRNTPPSRGSVHPAFYVRDFGNVNSGHDRDIFERRSNLDDQSITGDNTSYEYWRQLRRQLEREAGSSHSLSPDRQLLKPKKATHSRTVSHEDTLTGRGANPRTGVVSPSVVSFSSHAEGSEEDLGHPPDSQKWRLKGDQWISLDTREETPKATPPAMENKRRPPENNPYWRQKQPQTIDIPQESNAAVPLSELEDRFVVNMPSAREPCPPTMTAEQIEAFQRSISQAHREKAFTLGPKAASSANDARDTAPEKPVKRDFSIIRKAVGSSPSTSRRKQSDADRGYVQVPRGQDLNAPRASSGPTPRQKQYYNADDAGRDLTGSTFIKQGAPSSPRNQTVSPNPFLDLSRGQGNEMEDSNQSPPFPNTNSSLPPLLTSGINTRPVMAGEQQRVPAGTHQEGRNSLEVQQITPNTKQCQCRSHTIPGKTSTRPQWLWQYLPSLRKGEQQPTTPEKENQEPVASTNINTSTITTTPITTTFRRDQSIDQKQRVGRSHFRQTNGVTFPRRTTIDHAASHPPRLIDTRALTTDEDAASYNVGLQRSGPSPTHAGTTPAQTIHSPSPSDMAGSTHTQETPNGDRKTGLQPGELCEKCQVHYHVSKKNQTPCGLDKSYILVEQTCVRPADQKSSSRKGKLHRRNTDRASVTATEPDKPTRTPNVLTKASPEPAPASTEEENPPPADDASSDFAFLERLFSLLSESYTQLQQHRVFQHTKTVVNKLLSMAAHCFDVIIRIYDSCCVYSQTGSWPELQDKELNQLIRDVGRAAVYLVVLVIVAALLGRAWSYIVIVGSWFLWVLMPIRWAIWRVCGMIFSSV
ncbi:hypothetical protein FQN54_002977 [Arachnomyces sp. PD_36]|nr:hypothetical protein FQN54_002977 [Arachnomyces sp. PD_36]